MTLYLSTLDEKVAVPPFLWTSMLNVKMGVPCNEFFPGLFQVVDPVGFPQEKVSCEAPPGEATSSGGGDEARGHVTHLKRELQLSPAQVRRS